MKLDTETYDSFRRIVIYLSPDEGRHYAENYFPKRHIFRDVMKLAKFLDANAPKSHKAL
jgi:hypothetical protein